MVVVHSEGKMIYLAKRQLLSFWRIGAKVGISGLWVRDPGFEGARRSITSTALKMI
jgi:hypothetical protein